MQTPPTVLLVDNDPFLRRVYANRLMAHGYNVLIAEDVVKASHLAGSHVPDAILCDVQADNGQGLELVQALKESSNTAHIPVLCLSNSWEEKHKNEALEAGAHTFGIKSHLTPTEITAHIERMLA